VWGLVIFPNFSKSEKFAKEHKGNLYPHSWIA